MKKVGKIGAVYVWQSGNLIPVKGQFLIHGRTKKTKFSISSKSLNDNARPTADEKQNTNSGVIVSAPNGELKDGAK